MRRYILFLLLLAGSLVVEAQNKFIKTEQFKVWGNCEMCKHRIETTLLENKAGTAFWDVATKIVTVSYDSTQTSKAQLQKKLAEAGHDTETFTAEDAVYEQLPGCCHYKRQKNIPSKPSDKKTHIISGVVLEETIKGRLNPIANATVMGLLSNAHFVTDNTGVFQIEFELPNAIVVSYVGFEPDTINITKPDMLTIILKNGKTGALKEVVVTANNRFTRVSSQSITNTLLLGAQELTKAACCNLSESFETSPSVDVSYSDAVTGMKQIQMLGLSGNYSQLITENIPETKGLAGNYGLSFIPGPWIEGIQITKGTGSVANGYESMAGQINIEELKPDIADKFLLNTYINSMGRIEANLNLAKKINEKWSVGLLSHANGVVAKNDNQKDGFLDIPLGHQINFINRWKYRDNNGWIGQLAIKVMNDKRIAGQVDFNKTTDRGHTDHYGIGINNAQYIVTGKLGYVFPRHKYKSLGLMLSAGSFGNDAFYGLTEYLGKQKSFYANFIYQSIINNTAHKFRTGLSFSNEQYDESFNTTGYTRTETAPGVFFEYTYTIEKFSAIAGLREDYHNLFGWITTPRLHIKYDFTTRTNLRFSAGSGFRMANIFAENAGVFVSARKYEILNPSNKYGYGLEPEKAWNIGANFIHNFTLNNHKGSIALDAYYTRFTNQTISDLEESPQKIFFYNLDGASYSNSLQAELNYALFKNFDVRLAYRQLDVQTTYNGKQMQKPFVAPHRVFMNLAYETNNKWKLDYTVQWLSSKRLPSTDDSPAGLRFIDYSPSYIQMAAQITKVFNSNWEVYIGGENLSNYVQKNLIIDGQHPFGQYFDAAMIWGPVVGRMIYAGMRYRIKS